MPTLSDYTGKGNRAHFLKARLKNTGVEILSGQNSSMIKAFGEANALVFLPEDKLQIKQGQNVKVLLLPAK